MKRNQAGAPSGDGAVWRLPIVRVTAMVATATLVAVIAAGVWAASWSDASSSGSDPGSEHPPDDTAPPSPRPTPGASSPPAGDPEASPTPPPGVRPPADATAPAPPVVRSPADGIATNDSTPAFSGTGEPGAEVHVQLVDPGSGRATTVAAAQVDSAGTWTATNGAPLPDGRHVLLVMQVDAAGYVSDAARRVIVIDTAIAAPTIDALPTGPQRLLPVITGTGEPGALVTVRDETGSTIDAVAVDAGGRWSLALPDPGRDEVTLTATQADAAGNISGPSAAAGPLVLARPSLTVDPSVPSDGGATVVDFTVTGAAGTTVEVAVDGMPASSLALGGGTATGSTPPLSDGTHTISVRYREGSRVGSWSSVTVTVAADSPSPAPTEDSEPEEPAPGTAPPANGSGDPAP